MSHLRCPDCGVTVANRDAHEPTRPCPRCLVRTGVRVWMQPRVLMRPAPRFGIRGH